jgi:hypothetical protein
MMPGKLRPVVAKFYLEHHVGRTVFKVLPLCRDVVLDMR